MLKTTRGCAGSVLLQDRPVPSMPSQPRDRPPYLLISLLTLLVLILLAHIIAFTHTAYPTMATDTCLKLIRYTDYRKFLNRQVQTIEEVQFVDQLTGGKPAALVTVDEAGPQRLLDVYIYGCTMQQHRPELTMLLREQGLIQGGASVSPANTLEVSALDPTLPASVSPMLGWLPPRINREYGWRAGKFVQVLFPGLYPVTSRLEAEELQEQGQQGQAVPWIDPLATTLQMARDVFHWSSDNMSASLQTQSLTTAQVLLVEQTPHIEVEVRLDRLIQPDSSGLWFVTRAQSAGITIDQAQVQAPLASPMRIRGSMAADQGQDMFALFDHTLKAMTILNSPLVNRAGDSTFSCTLLYTNNVSDQPGLLLIEHLPQDSSAAGQLLLTGVLLD